MLIFGAFQILLSQIPDFDRLWFLSILAAVMSFSYSSIGLGLAIGKTTGTRSYAMYHIGGPIHIYMYCCRLHRRLCPFLYVLLILYKHQDVQAVATYHAYPSKTRVLFISCSFGHKLPSLMMLASCQYAASVALFTVQMKSKTLTHIIIGL